MKVLLAVLLLGVASSIHAPIASAKQSLPYASADRQLESDAPSINAADLRAGRFFSMMESEANCQYCYEESFGPTGLTAHYFEGTTCSGGGSQRTIVSLASESLPAKSEARTSHVLADGEGGGCKDCKAFNSCHSNTQQFSCRERHDACGAASSFAANTLKHFDTLSVAQARVLVKRSAGYLKLIDERRLLASLDCRGRIVGYVQVSDSSSISAPTD